MIKTALPPAPIRDGSSFDKAVKERLEAVRPTFLPSYTVQQLKALTPAEYSNAIVACSNGDAGGESLAYCNGRAWFVISLGDRISFS